MTKQFKAGDKVKVVDKGGNTYIELNKNYTVKSLTSWGDVTLEEVPDYAYTSSRFELVVTNGFGPDSKPMEFTADDIKMGMRFVMQDGAVYIGIGDNRIADGKGFCGGDPIHSDAMQVYTDSYLEKYTVMEVYAAPNRLLRSTDLIDAEQKGPLLWKRKDEKREALEATVAALKSALAKAEAELNQ